MLAGLMWAPASIRSAVEGGLTVGVNPLGLLFLVQGRGLGTSAGVALDH